MRYIRLLLVFICSIQINVILLAEGKEGGANRDFRGIAYVTGGDEKQKLDLYLPPSGGKAVPLLVWIHGGGWAEGSRDFCPLKPLVDEGYAVASISYRLAPKAIFPAQIEDCRKAVAWLRAEAKNYGIDGDRIGVAGESAGGHLAALLGVGRGDLEEAEAYRVQAVVSLCPPVDLTGDTVSGEKIERLLKSDKAEEVARGKMDRSRKQIMERFFGGRVDERRELTRAASPLYQVSSEAAPFLFIHGDVDTLVPLSQSELLQEALKELGVYAELYVVEGAGHGFGRFSPEILAKVREFFAERL